MLDMYHLGMKTPLVWADDKNESLIKRHGIGFENLILAINSGGLLDDLPHRNQEIFSHQRQAYVQLENYVYVVSYVPDNDHTFLKTFYPSRTATKRYLPPKSWPKN